MQKPSLLPAVLALALAVPSLILHQRNATAAPETPQPPVSAPAMDAPSGAPAVPGADAREPAADLPTIVVPQRPVHAVPEGEALPARPVTLKGRDGRDVALRSPSTSARRSAPSAPPLMRINGAARVGEILSLTVQGRTVRLFGVQPPQAGDRCAANADMAPRPCLDLAHEALAARLKGDDAVACRVPPGQRAPVPAAVCFDATGTDLAGFLVAQGLAVFDPRQSYDYVGAESAARSSRRGLWRYR